MFAIAAIVVTAIVGTIVFAAYIVGTMAAFLCCCLG
jgi:hypothetical protein